jgi:hypothetical protein
MGEAVKMNAAQRELKEGLLGAEEPLGFVREFEVSVRGVRRGGLTPPRKKRHGLRVPELEPALRLTDLFGLKRGECFAWRN